MNVLSSDIQYNGSSLHAGAFSLDCTLGTFNTGSYSFSSLIRVPVANDKFWGTIYHGASTVNNLLILPYTSVNIMYLGPN